LRERADENLVLQARRGDRDAFAELIDRHRGRVYSVLLRSVGDRDMAEDLTQETFVRAYERLDSFSPSGSRFQSWLLTIATRIAIDSYRRRRPTESLEKLSEESGFDPPSTARTEAGAESAEVAATVGRYLQRLPERQRMAVTLKHIEGLPFSEIAQIMGCTVNSAKVHAHRGRLQLARYMGHLREEAAR
jgi:RNA polymerase sigma-70 factor, ECF subfamily